MSQTQGVWGKADCSLVRKIAVLCQHNLVRALRDKHMVSSLRTHPAPTWMKSQRYMLAVLDLGSEEDLDGARALVLTLGGFLGEPIGQEETDVYALSIWLADALHLFAACLEARVRKHYPVSMRGWLSEGRIALWAIFDDLEALTALVALEQPLSPSPLVPGEPCQALLWDEPLQGQEEAR